MAIHFNMGGPVMVSPTSNVPSVCVSFVYDVEYELTVTWKGECMADDYSLPNKVIGIPRGDYRRIVVNVVDDDSVAVDISGFSKVEYVIADTVEAYPVITKTLADGIVIGGDNSSFVITLSESDTSTIPHDYAYHECRLTNGSEGQTLFAGVLRSPDTILGTD